MTEALWYIDGLTGDDYPVWVVRMKALLISKGLWHLANPTTEEKEIDDRQISEQALALIILTLEEDQTVHIGERRTAREGWKKLILVHAEEGTSSYKRLYEQLFTL